MNRSVIIIIGALVLCGVAILGALYVAEQRNTKGNGEVYEEAPKFTLPDGNGNNVSLTEVDGDVKIINFWASWSPYSKDELKTLETLKQEFGEKVDIVALSRDHNIEDAKVFLSEHNIDGGITFVFDEEDEYFNMMEGYAVPESIFLNRRGEVVYRVHKPLTYGEFKERVTAILE